MHFERIKYAAEYTETWLDKNDKEKKKTKPSVPSE